jgi:hypothetical protein
MIENILNIILKTEKLFPMIGKSDLIYYICKEYFINIYTMTELPYTVDNKELIQEFIYETRKRISNGVSITFTAKASSELADLMLEHDITADNIEHTILNLTTENYFRGIDPSGSADFKVCAFRALVGKDNIEIYLKYGIENNGLQILIFSNHIPDYPMDQPFKN